LNPAPFFHDDFTDDRRPGSVIGQPGCAGIVRLGRDAEHNISIDNGALRIQPLIKPGWGRSGLVYGPFQRENGLAFAALVLNGHNTSQTGDLTENLPRRLYRWIRGSETEGIAGRLRHWLVKGHKQRTIRQFARWARIAWDHRNDDYPEINENLAAGWFCQEAPANPIGAGSIFIMHATGAENGELWSQMNSAALPLIRGLQNIPVLYLVLLREKGAAYYVSSIPNAPGMAGFPQMRPVAVDPSGSEAELYAGLYQSVLGQIGFRVDTRVQGTQVAKLQQYASWYGTAHAADAMHGSGRLENTPAEAGGNWLRESGQFERTAGGARASGVNNRAVLDPGQTSGLINLLLDLSTNEPVEISLLWRVKDPQSYWRFTAGNSGSRLEIVENGTGSEIGVSSHSLTPNATNILQILDDGKIIQVSLNGKLAFDTWFNDDRLRDATATGIDIPQPCEGLCIHSFEAHPRTMPIPAEIQVGCIQAETGEQVQLRDDFRGPAGDLSGHVVTLGHQMWRKELGAGTIELTGEGAVRVHASARRPNPGRTAYTVAWDHLEFADVQVEITPPGDRRWAGEGGRGGLIFWQDASHYIAIGTWLDDYYDGTSISSFFALGDFEELYDAVWTNIGRKVIWGVPYTMRVIFDGRTYTVFINEEPVLQRSLTDIYPEFSHLAINRIGLLANWEWGNDTGSIFRNFTARRKGGKAR